MVIAIVKIVVVIIVVCHDIIIRHIESKPHNTL